ncbi:amidohydrolase [Tenacibaculum sp. M341]|uniref:amidohydrolase n=1 Tax=Tenacibaculum sp. M341 TaxID=2530339 RepID=UPI00104E547C|nr:amidohydrolase [Tenacibaculum sp. M341]TCI92677.1 amidohydrolase [Tenacibaculum sp. M341]
MKNIILLSVLGFLTYACQTKEKVDALVINGKVYTVNDAFDMAESFAVKDGKFIAIGNNQEILEKYTSEKIIDVKGQSVYPGLIDGHCHFFNLGIQQQKVDLMGTKSYEEVLQKLIDFQKEKSTTFITGRGWDQNDWEVKEFPTKEKLDSIFPNTPVSITRVDGHAALVNQKAMDISGITDASETEGGEFIKKDGKLTGVLIDNAMDFVKIPAPTKREQIQALKDAEKINFSYGLTTVSDAGLDKPVIELIDSLQKTGELKMKIYAMVSATQENLDYYIKKGIIKTDRLHVRSFKVYGDGALGSRGAALKEPYSDRHNHFGALIYPPKRYEEIAAQIASSTYQMNTHAIGDSTNYLMLKTYHKVLKGQKDRRWRIEHAQIVDEQDFNMFENIVPSIQPTHATSDMYWATDRVGEKRIKGGYAFKKLLNVYGKVALGTDYPVEKVNPFLTFYAAVARKDLNNYPKEGYQMENALTREETIKGMTIWNAYANFEENDKGSIEVGKAADFVILNQDIMQIDIDKVPSTKVLETFSNGEKVN